jgi:hypothetical protein
MAGYKLIGENPLRYQDHDTGVELPVYKYKAPATQEELLFIIQNKRVVPVRFTPRLLADKSFQQAFGVEFSAIAIDSKELTTTKLDEVKNKSTIVSEAGP